MGAVAVGDDARITRRRDGGGAQDQAGARRVLQRRACPPRARSPRPGPGPRTALIEASWAYRFKPAIGVTLRRRQHDATPGTLARSWQAQRRLHSKYQALTARRKPPGMALTAVARELAGFVWAEMTS